MTKILPKKGSTEYFDAAMKATSRIDRSSSSRYYFLSVVKGLGDEGARLQMYEESLKYGGSIF
jgi:hypothetical protein